MLRHFQPFFDVKKLIELQSQEISYRVTKEPVTNKSISTKKQTVPKQKRKTLGMRKGQ